MRVYENGVYRDMTPEEIAASKKEARKAEAIERTRPLTEQEVLAMLIPQQINILSVDDNTALRMMEFYPRFEDIIGKTVKKGFKFTYGGKLWATVQPEMTIQAHYPPSVGMESLYAEICESHAGTEDDPIPYSGNMALEQGKYYMQDYEIYLCTRDTLISVYNPLSELVGIYVELV